MYVYVPNVKVWNLCGALLHGYYGHIMNFSATISLQRVSCILGGKMEEVFVP